MKVKEPRTDYPELTALMVRRTYDSDDMWLCASPTEIRNMIIDSTPTCMANIVEDELARLHKDGDDRVDYEALIDRLGDDICSEVRKALTNCMMLSYTGDNLQRERNAVKLIFTAHLLESLYVKWYGYDRMVDVRAVARDVADIK